MPHPLTPSRLSDLAGRLASRSPRLVEQSERPRAAVAVVLAADSETLLLIRRAEREGDRWSGHLALPGGRWSPGDPDLQETARRETLEEVGVDLSSARLLGTLDDLTPRTSVLPPILVRPFVYLLPARAPLILNPEVAAAWWLPLDELLAPGALRPVEFARHGTLVRTLGYQLQEGILWGMTERILRDLFRPA